MSWGMVAVAGATLVGGAMSANASKKAAASQSGAADAASQAQLEQYYQTRKDQLPWLNTGQAGVTRLGEMLGLDVKGPGSPIPQGAMSATEWARANGYNLPEHRDWFDHEINNLYEGGYQKYLDGLRGAGGQAAPGENSLMRDFTVADFVKDPGYEFRLSEGNKAIENAARARGTYMGPATVKDLLRYGQDYASGEFQNAYNRDLTNKTTKFNMLSGVSGTGQVAANTMSNSGSNMVNNVGNLMTGAANARGAASIAGTNAFTGGINTIGNFYQQQQNRNQQQAWMNQMFPQQQQAPNSGMWWGNQ